MEDSSTPSIKIGDYLLDANSYFSLLEYLIKSLKKGLVEEEVKQKLVDSGWKTDVVDFIYNAARIFEKFSSSSSERVIQEKSLVLSSSSGGNDGGFATKEDLEKLSLDLKNAIKEFDKFSGKLEANDSKFSNYDERVSVFKDTVSEMRGMVLSSEKRMGEFELKVEKVNSIIAAYDPLVLEKKFATVEKSLNIQESEVSKYIAEVKESKRIMNEYVSFMSKIKSEESLLAVLADLKKKVEKISAIEKNIEKMSGKVESIFLEFQDKLDVLMRVSNKTESYDDILKDLIRDVDALTTKGKTFITKEDFAKKLSGFSDDLESVKSVVFDLAKKNSVTPKVKKDEVSNKDALEKKSEEGSGVSSVPSEKQALGTASQLS